MAVQRSCRGIAPLHSINSSERASNEAGTVKPFGGLEVDDVAGARHMVAGDRNDLLSEAILNFVSHLS